MNLMRQTRDLRRIVSTRMPTQWGEFRLLAFESDVVDGTGRTEAALAMILDDVTEGAPLLRVHSQCLTSEVLGSLRCDCNDQLNISMQRISSAGRGLVIYEFQEGRGIGLMAKLHAYALQDTGLDTVEANHRLGFADDYRDFSLPAAILHELGVMQVRLLSNNLRKAHALADAGIEIVERIPCEAAPNPHSLAYLRAKKEKMGHVLRLEEAGATNHAAPASREEHAFARIDEAIREIRAGRMIVVIDDEDRENEGDLTMAAEKITPEAINFMAKYGRGLVCLAMTEERLDYLASAMMSRREHFATSAPRSPNPSTHGRRHDRHLGLRPLAHHSGRHRSRNAAPTISRVPDTSSRCAPAKAACWCAPDKPKPPSISRACRAWFPPA